MKPGLAIGDRARFARKVRPEEVVCRLFSDARIISVMVDGCLIVIKHNSTHKTAARMAVQLLQQINAPIMGGVLNAVEASSGRYGDYHYHAYKFYSKYYNQDNA